MRKILGDPVINAKPTAGRQKTEAVAGFTDWPYLCHLLVRHPATWVSLALLWTLPMGYSVCLSLQYEKSHAFYHPLLVCYVESLTKRCFFDSDVFDNVGSGGINLRADLLRIRQGHVSALLRESLESSDSGLKKSIDGGTTISHQWWIWTQQLSSSTQFSDTWRCQRIHI